MQLTNLPVVPVVCVGGTVTVVFSVGPERRMSKFSNIPPPPPPPPVTGGLRLGWESETAGEKSMSCRLEGRLKETCGLQVRGQVAGISLSYRSGVFTHL